VKLKGVPVVPLGPGLNSLIVWILKDKSINPFDYFLLTLKENHCQTFDHEQPNGEQI